MPTPVRSPKPLILDEMTSEVNFESQARIQAALEILHGRVIVLMFVQHLSIVLSAAPYAFSGIPASSSMAVPQLSLQRVACSTISMR